MNDHTFEQPVAGKQVQFFRLTAPALSPASFIGGWRSSPTLNGARSSPSSPRPFEAAAAR